MARETGNIPVAPDGAELKDRIINFCQEQGTDLIGFAPVERWKETGKIPSAFWPTALWPPTRTVIVLGLSMPLPIIETTPSILHKELYDTCNHELDALAFNLVRFLNRQGCAAYFFTRDGFSSIKVLKKRMMAAFSHVAAAYYAGLGTIGLSHNLLTPEYGPRVRFVSVFSSVELAPNPVMEKDLCIKCLACVKCCPKQALTPVKDQLLAEYDKMACAEMAHELTRRRCYPCGICTKVCPIGRDRLLYRQKGYAKKYSQEADALAANPDDPAYHSWNHVRKYGIWQNDYEKESAEND